MSVMCGSLKMYEQVLSKIKTYQFNNTIDINYCRNLSLEDEAAEKTVRSWFFLNELSYVCRYGGEMELYELPFYSRETIDTYQMLKYLNFIEYNIEINTIEANKGSEIIKPHLYAFEKLKHAINEIRQIIINQLPEYKNAKWG